MRYATSFLTILIVGAVLAATPVNADHFRPGIFTDLGALPAEEGAIHGNVSALLMIERCARFVNSVRIGENEQIRDYTHSYGAGFCLGWINASMVFLNVRNSAGAPALGVCLPEGIHSDEVAKVFLDFVKENPDDQKYSPTFIIYWALLDKYSCKS
jgi:Rap1a immunity proteins